MKSAVKVSIFFVLLGAVLANAQYTLPKFEHVIIIVQENRTPDNLFGAATLNPPNLPTLGSGVDLTIAPANTQNGNQPGQPWCLGACFDPKHGNGAWQSQYNAGTYNSCPNGQVTTSLCPASTCNGQTVCPGTGCTLTVPNCPQETYVSPIYDDEPSGVFEGSSPLLPYFDIAHKYGFANYFFQTNQGPSQPAHDFLFGGTSAPTGVVPPPGQNNYYNYFAAGNAVGGSYGQQGCLGPGSEYVLLIDPTGAVNKNYKPSPCFEHQTLVDLLESTNPNFTWKYYTDNPGDIWTAPNGIGHICGVPQLQNGQYVCTGSDFGNVVNPPWAFFADVIEGGTNLPDGDGHGSCQLPNVTWIIPNGYWSDHPGIRHGLSTMNELGPDWVAAIINAVGGATCYDEINQEPWQDTVIFVVWDDWGGFYDHLGDIGLPAQAQGKPGYAPCLFSSDWGCGYTYGFRVPFLVISAYTSDGYVSGACGFAVEPSYSCGARLDGLLA